MVEELIRDVIEKLPERDKLLWFFMHLSNESKELLGMIEGLDSMSWYEYQEYYKSKRYQIVMALREVATEIHSSFDDIIVAILMNNYNLIEIKGRLGEVLIDFDGFLERFMEYVEREEKRGAWIQLLVMIKVKMGYILSNIVQIYDAIYVAN